MTEQLEYVTYLLTSPESVITPYVNISTIVTSFVSIFIAAIALRFTKIQIEKHDKHNRLTVRPYLNDSTYIDNDGKLYAFAITNKGMGPAIIKDMKIFFNDELVEDDDDTLEKTIRLITEGKPISGFGHETVSIGSYVSPNEKIDLATVSTRPPYSPEKLREDIMSSTYILITYESIYGESFNYDSRV
ncbi:hypothetical protein [Pseudomonas pergaminensis]